jgi:HK97 gp10 family phage protein
MADAMSIKFDADAAFSGLEKLGAQAGQAVRPAAQAGAQVLYEEARRLCPVSAEAHYFYGSAAKKAPPGQKKQLAYLFQPGNLRDAVYQVFSKDNSGATKATYHISWNHAKAPYGYMVEFGTSKAPAHAFVRPAYDAKQESALQAAKARFVSEMKAVQ